jgi:chromatin remodeling complex protein RSC6
MEVVQLQPHTTGEFMAADAGLNKPVRLKSDLAAFCGSSELSRTAVTQKFWDYIKEKKLQAKTENGAPEGNGKFIVADDTLIKLFNATKVTSKSSGKVTDFTQLKVGETINMMQLASVVGANLE